jgi:hypothetical protein
MVHGASEVDYRTAAIAIDGKLRGSRARRLGDDLGALFTEGYDQVLLDLGGCASLDSVGALAILAALEKGQSLFLVIGAAREDVLPPEVAWDPRLRCFGDRTDAVRHIRSREGSGILVP